MTDQGIAPPVLQVESLSIAYGPLQAVRDVSFRIAPGEAYGLIGESGSGKSTIAYAVMRYIRGGIATGRVLLAGQDVMALPDAGLAAVRGRVVAMVYQDPMSALNPALTVGAQIAESVRLHRDTDRRRAWARATDLLDRVHLPDPARMARRYPHQLSGGQQQRVVIAMALACDPTLLIMDEPTTGLDVSTEAVILDLVDELRRESAVSILFISHNMAVVARLCDRIGVLYAGQLVEEGAAADVLRRPRHPYTVGLLRAIPGRGEALTAIPGRLPDLRAPPPGCIFEPRCRLPVPAPLRQRCPSEMPGLTLVAPPHRARCHFPDIPFPAAQRSPLTHTAVTAAAPANGRPHLQVVGLDHSFVQRRLFGRAVATRAVADVTLEVAPGQTLAVVGESGSGKSTLARCVAGLLTPAAGAIRLASEVLPPRVKDRTRAQQRAVQFIFQNPEAALNPHWTVEAIIARPLLLYERLSAPARRARVLEQLEAVQLGERYLALHPGQLSGGEKQRVAIARAFVARPSLVICDEPTSALDVSVQAAILNELLALQARYGTSYLFITHDLGVVQQVAHRVAVMHQGRIVEAGDPADVLRHPQHPYTRRLVAAVPLLPDADPEPAVTTGAHAAE